MERKIRVIDLFEANSVSYQVISEMDGENQYCPKDWIDYENFEYLPFVSKPQRTTLLHHYIYDVYIFHLSYLVDKHFSEETIENIIKEYDAYEYETNEIKSLKEEYYKLIETKADFSKYDDLADLFLSYYKKSLMTVVVDDVFSVLFQNKVFLRDFNLQLADLISSLEYHDHPEILKKDGVLKRCNNVPEWLKQGVYFRDKGRCQLCGTDLTSTLNNVVDKHYDHIVPLELGGTNDPTNFQLCCSDCNLKKGDRNCSTKNLVFPFWDIETDSL